MSYSALRSPWLQHLPPAPEPTPEPVKEPEPAPPAPEPHDSHVLTQFADENVRRDALDKSLRMECATPDFFKLPPEKVSMEYISGDPEMDRVGHMQCTGKVYFLHKGQIVAVAKRVLR